MFDKFGVVVKDVRTNKNLETGNKVDNLYTLTSRPAVALFSIQQQATTSTLWHHRLGHANNHVLDLLKSKNKIKVLSSALNLCGVYQMTKSTKLPFSSSTSSTNKIFQKIHCDLWGPTPVISNQGFSYYVILFDEFSRYSWLFLLKRK